MAKINIFDNYLKDDAYLFIKPVVELGIFTFMNSADGKINHTYEYQVVNLGVPYRDGNIKQMMGTQDRTWSWDGYLTSTTAMTAHEQMEAIEMLLKNGLPVSLVYLGHCWNVVIKSFSANILRECRVDYSITVEEYIPTYMQYKPAKIIPIIPPEYGIIPPPPGGGGGDGGIPTNPNDPCADQPCSEIRLLCNINNPIIYSGYVNKIKKDTTSGPDVNTNDFVNYWISQTKEQYFRDYSLEYPFHNSWLPELQLMVALTLLILSQILSLTAEVKVSELLSAGTINAEDRKRLLHCITNLPPECLQDFWYEELSRYMTTPCVTITLYPPARGRNITAWWQGSLLQAGEYGYIFSKGLQDYLTTYKNCKIYLEIRKPSIEISQECIEWCKKGEWYQP